MRAGTHKSRLAQPKKKRSRCAAFICSRVAVTGVRGVRGAVARLVGNEEGVVSGVINLESSGVKRRTVDHAMTGVTTKPDSWQLGAETAPHLFDDWFDPIESEVRARAPSSAKRCCRTKLSVATLLLIWREILGNMKRRAVHGILEGCATSLPAQLPGAPVKEVHNST